MRMRNLRNDGGSALVELALVLPLLCLLLVGSVELGRIAYFAIEVSDAARAGVAYGSQSAATAGDTGNIADAAKFAAADLPTLVATSSSPCVCETITSSTGTDTTAPIIGACGGVGSTAAAQCSTLAPGVTKLVINYVQVNTTATVSTMFHYPGIPTSFTLHGFAQMRVVQDL